MIFGANKNRIVSQLAPTRSLYRAGRAALTTQGAIGFRD
jgi:hypothetical protein